VRAVLANLDLGERPQQRFRYTDTAGKMTPLAAYAVIWGLSTPIELIRGAFAARGPWEVAVVALCLCVVAMPEKSSVQALAFGARAVWWLTRLPFTWDSEVMAFLSDLAVVLHVVAADGVADDDPKAVHAAIGVSIRRQLGWFCAPLPAP
jgi:hypothetical protein